MFLQVCVLAEWQFLQVVREQGVSATSCRSAFHHSKCSISLSVLYTMAFTHLDFRDLPGSRLTAIFSGLIDDCLWLIFSFFLRRWSKLLLYKNVHSFIISTS